MEIHIIRKKNIVLLTSSYWCCLL